MAVQLQWSIDSSANSALSVARNAFQAAMADNVQPLAILACERFGNTIAMCPETCKKIELLMSRTGEPVTVRFIGALLGFSPQDSASQLSKSLAGTQFLGLAAAMVTSMSLFQAGNALHEMLVRSASDRTLLPTAMQLQYLLEKLEPRCQQCGFAEMIIGWQIFLCKSLAMSREERESVKNFEGYPDAAMLEKLVDALRQLARIGDPKIARLTITTGFYAAWIVAFTRWSVGRPPAIITQNGTVVLDQPDSQITVIVNQNSDHYCLKIEIQHSIDQPGELIAANDNTTVGALHWLGAGMVDIESYGKWLLLHLDLDMGLGHRALIEALPHAILLAVKALHLTQHENAESHMVKPRSREIPYQVKGVPLSPFPTNRKIFKVLSQLLRLSDATSVLPSEPTHSLADLPEVGRYLSTFATTCKCSFCCDSSKHGESDKSMTPPEWDCKTNAFIGSIAHVVADILAISLFEYPESLKLRPGHARFGSISLHDKLRSSIYDAIHPRGSKGTYCHVRCLISLALSLVGHPDNTNGWIMSGRKGQVVYPTIYETSLIEQTGYLALSWQPGHISFEGVSYTLVRGLDSSDGHGDPLSADMEPKVLRPCNLVPDYKMIWEVTHLDGYLGAWMVVDSEGKIRADVIRSPAQVLYSLSDAVYLDCCSHDPQATYQDSFDPFSFSFTSPLDPVPAAPGALRAAGMPNWEKGIVAIEGNPGLRLFVLGDPKTRAVIRGQACVRCCLEFCQRANRDIVLL